jgi:hypothetical protein
MSIGKKLAHKAEAVKGATTKYFGRATPRPTSNSRGQGKGRVQTLRTGLLCLRRI